MSAPELPLIVSPDTRRGQRIPPRQALTRKWPVLHAGSTPTFDRAHWTFHIFGLVERPWQCSYDEFLALPRARVLADMHCVTRWSKLDNTWEGVSTRKVMSHVRVLPEARFVMIHCEHGFTTNLPLDDFLAEDCLFAWQHNGQDLEPDHGYPLRLVVPRLYAWKSAKWARAVELLPEDRAGFWESWENGGYHMRGDPWNEERFPARFMDLANRFIGGLPPGPLSFVLLLGLGTLTLLFSMIVASRRVGGIDFGPAHIVAAKGAGLLVLVTLLNYFTCGILLAGAVWLFGLMFLFGLEYAEARVLTRINWGMSLVWKVLLLTWKL